MLERLEYFLRIGRRRVVALWQALDLPFAIFALYYRHVHAAELQRTQPP